ncbi:MAG: hypothetical protein U0Q19_11765 [Kineosporiaceae bacterium]
MSATSILSQNLRDFVYLPTTVWREFFRPTFYFGCNVNDLDTEHEVLGDVGSYGKQLNRILDALMVIIELDDDRIDQLDTEAKEAIYALRVLHKDASRASARAEARQN